MCEVETVGDSLTGRASVGDGESREFTGWLGLLGALQALIAETDLAATGEPPRGPEPKPRPTDPHEVETKL